MQSKQSGKKERKTRTVRERINRKDGAKLMEGLLAHYFSRHKIVDSLISMQKRSKVRINSVISRCPGELHFWCESNVGRIRKPVGSIPLILLSQWAQDQKTGRFIYG